VGRAKEYALVGWRHAWRTAKVEIADTTTDATIAGTIRKFMNAKTVGISA
jgi:hypothetical protein